MSSKKKIIFLVGPTAVGKSMVALELAQKINCEIISCDSMQVYKELNIASDKPAKYIRKKIPHHLIDVVSVKENYNVADYCRQAIEIIKNIHSRCKIPLFVGGSGLYMKALVDGLFSSQGKNDDVRMELRRLAAEKGALFLHNRLKGVDPASAKKIHPNDLKKVIRALEIYELEKKTKTSLKRKTKGLKDKYEIKIFGLTMPRDKLYDRINRRVELMFKNGIIREVRELWGQNLSITSRQALGIRQIEDYLKKKYAIEEAKEILKRDTRRFAKRQLTWFRADKRIIWLNIYGMKDEQVINFIEKKIKDQRDKER